MKLQKTVGEKIRAARLNKELSQAEMEGRTGINQGNLSRMENGQKDIHLSTLERIAEAMGKDVKINLEDK
jgi:transcriptional regulator with XRE-family HTH domain